LCCDFGVSLEGTGCLHRICFKLGEKHGAEGFEVLKVAFGEQIMGRTHVFEWFFKFTSGVTNVYVKCLTCHW
jgi:hypothetical protein